MAMPRRPAGRWRRWSTAPSVCSTRRWRSITPFATASRSSCSPATPATRTSAGRTSNARMACRTARRWCEILRNGTTSRARSAILAIHWSAPMRWRRRRPWRRCRWLPTPSCRKIGSATARRPRCRSRRASPCRPAIPRRCRRRRGCWWRPKTPSGCGRWWPAPSSSWRSSRSTSGVPSTAFATSSWVPPRSCGRPPATCRLAATRC
jgi:hypothetical protein